MNLTQGITTFISLLLFSSTLSAQFPSDWDWYPHGLDQATVKEKGVSRLEVSNDDRGYSKKAQVYDFDKEGRIVRMKRYSGSYPGTLYEFGYDKEGRLVSERQSKVEVYGEPKAEPEVKSEEKFTFTDRGRKNFKKDESGEWVLDSEEFNVRYLDGKPSRVEYLKKGQLHAIRFEVFHGDPVPPYPPNMPIQVNRYDKEGHLIHQTEIEEVPMVMSVDDDPSDYTPSLERAEKYFAYRNDLVIEYTDSSFFEGKFDRVYGYTALYDVKGRLMEKHFKYQRDNTYLKYNYVYEDLRTIETRTSDISSFSSYKETETLLNDGGLPSKVIEKEGNNGKGIYSEIIRTEFKYEFWNP